MSENVLDLHELDELKAAYNQMDERLDGQDIVSDENLREAMYNKFANLRQSAKEGLVYFNLIFVPVILWRDWSNQTITLFGTIVMTVYWVASLLFRMFILRKTNKEDYGTYDLKTLTEKESRYQKYLKWGNIVFVLFWAAYFGQMLLVKGTTAFFVFLVLFLTLLMPVLIRYLIIKYKYNGEAIDPATGQPRKLTSTYFQVLGLVFLGIISCAILTMFVLGLIYAEGLYDVLNVMNVFPMFVASVALLLTVFHVKKKITVSSKVITALIAIAIVMSLAIIGIGYFMNIGIRTGTNFLFSVACFSIMAHYLYKTRK